jgi:hypothetical protein
MVAAALLPWASAPAARAATSPTVVSLTFDDGTATQYQARSLLSSHGMHGTFYINSSKLGTDSYYMTWKQVDDLAADGNEIGGHTSYHVDLTQTDATEAKRQLCDDRVNLLNRGYQVTSFAYPFGAYNSTVKSIVRDCGYNSARTTNQISPPPAESIPPQDPYATRVAGAAGSNVSLSTLQSYVTKVEQNGGGWAQLVFHQICDGCDANSIPVSTLSAFLDWLAPRASTGTVVKTVGDVIGGAVQPPVAGPPAPPPPNGTNALRNASLEQDSNADQIPDCFDLDSWGSNTYKWTRTTDAHTGSYAERVDVSNYSSGDSKLVVTRDLGFCTPSVSPGRRYRLTAWYKSSDPVNFTTFTRDSVGGFYFWTTSPSFPASSTWTQASWVSPTVPNGVNGLSFGLALPTNGSLTVDDLGVDDAAATGGSDVTPPTVSVTAPADGATIAGGVTISANATDNLAVDHVDFLVDGEVVGTLTSGPFNFTWDSNDVANGSHTITARAVDTAGNSAASAPVSITVSNSNINLLQNPSLETGSGNTPTCWQLGGFGANSFTWTRTSDARTGDFAERLDVTDLTDGDRKLVSAQDLGLCAPTVTPGHAYTVRAYYKSDVQTRIFAYYRNASGAWTFWSSAAFPASPSSWARASWVTPAVPSGATNLSIGMGLSIVGSATMDDFALSDNAPAGDTTPPTSTISCNGAGDAAGCASGWYNAPVSVALSATDETAGSGVKEIRYTTDGSDPTASSGTVYGGPFSVASTTTVKYRAFDNAGNAESVHSQLIRIDTTAPTVSLTAPADGATVKGTVALTATADDNVGVDSVEFLVDGQVVGTDISAPYSADWDSKTIADGTHAITARAIDLAGNTTRTSDVSVTIANDSLPPDTTPPTTTIACNAAACASSYYNVLVSVALSATDETGGSGVKEIRYTTDGSDPTASSGNVYQGAFTVSSTTTVKYRAIDNAGNAETIRSQLIRIDTTAPSVAITAPTNGATVTANVKVTASASDSGSGIAKVTFYLDGKVLATVTSAPYSTQWNTKKSTKGKHTLTAVAQDNAGNTATSATVTVTVA